MVDLIVLLFSVPVGALFFFQARWLIRLLLGCYEKAERRVARCFGIYGALLIPLVYGIRFIEDAVPGTFGRILAMGLFAADSLLLAGPCFVLGLKVSRTR
jgi:hypothetical protein